MHSVENREILSLSLEKIRQINYVFSKNIAFTKFSQALDYDDGLFSIFTA